MKIAIVGAGLCGLSCALELERNGIVADIFERDSSLGWPMPEIGFWPEILLRDYGDVFKYLRENFKISLKPLIRCNNIIMKSPKNKVEINGSLGYSFLRGKTPDSVENQVGKLLAHTPVHFNSNVDYMVLAGKYDRVIVATGNDSAARRLGLWEDKGIIHIIGGVALGTFRPDSSTIYFNTEYAGSGYGRVAPFNKTKAMVNLYAIGRSRSELAGLFARFLSCESLDCLEFLYNFTPPPFTAGRVKSFAKGNIYLAGRSAGLTERLLGVGGVGAIISGIYAARAITQGLDYEARMKQLASWSENISSFRDIVNGFDNDDFDRLLAAVGKPGIKQLIYNTHIDFVENIGSLIKVFVK
ncbi:MAG TPA: NAD(P)-binding protein [Clostridia bacterium]|nr:NAD(P)-binding protein [Clostridia bacterium]